MDIEPSLLNHAIADVFQGLFGLTPTVADGSTVQEVPGGFLNTRVSITTHSQHYEIVLHFPCELGKSLAATMFALDLEHVQETELKDTSAELGNILAGCLQHIVLENHEIGLPVVSIVGLKTPELRGQLLIQTHCLCNGFDLIVAITMLPTGD